MAQAMQMTNVALPTSMDKKTYSVNFKGLIAHLLDILFVDNSTPRGYYAKICQLIFRKTSVCIVNLKTVMNKASLIAGFFVSISGSPQGGYD